MPTDSPTPAKSWPRRILAILLGLLLCHFIGTAWHEIIGHGLTGMAFGGKITSVHLLGFEVFPTLHWDRWTGQYGACDFDRIDNLYGEYCMLLGGSLSTFIVAVAASILLWARHWHRRTRIVLLWLSIWWIDMLTYLAPIWGLRRSILWGGTYSEPYDAAVHLGIPGGLFQIVVVVSCMLMATSTIMYLARCRVREGEAPAEPVRECAPPRH